MITAKERKELKAKVKNISMSLRQREIFSCKFGLYDGVYKSNAEVGKRYKITGEAVRLIIKKVKNLLES